MNNTITYQYLRPQKAKRLEEWYHTGFYERKDLKIENYRNAVILPLKRFEGDNLLFGRGGVVDCNGEYVDTSAINRRVQFGYAFENEKYEDKKVVYCGYLVKHWGHFLVEAVARLWYFLEDDNSIDKYVFFRDESQSTDCYGNYREFLELLGVWDKVEIINAPTRYKEIIVPELGYKWREYYSECYKSIFETISNNIQIKDEWKSFDKIFFTRTQLKGAQKKEFGYEMIDSFFHNNEYAIISPEKMSLSELIYLIRNAKICASISGSLPHNMLFAKDNQTLVIVERVTMNNEIQVDVNIMKSLDVTYIDANVALYPVDMGGPFIAAYSKEFEKYVENNKLIPPDKRFLTDGYMKNCFRKYMKSYKSIYGYQWYMMDWYFEYIDYIWEAYQSGVEYFSDYIFRRKPYKVLECFSVHFFIVFLKKAFKKLVGRNKYKKD